MPQRRRARLLPYFVFQRSVEKGQRVKSRQLQWSTKETAPSPAVLPSFPSRCAFDLYTPHFYAEEFVSALLDEFGGTQANVPSRLQTLPNTGLLARRKEGLQVFCSIAGPSTYKLRGLVCGSVGKQLAKQADEFVPTAA
jgi:DNA-binding transcriptional ArsR family regulator